MNILCIGAHPDDIEFGCGGTLCKMAGPGCRITLLVLTDGGRGGAAALRRVEQAAAARLIGARLIRAGFRDTELPGERALISAIEDCLRKTCPGMIFTHFYEDTHQDHCAVSRAVMTAARNERDILFFEGPTSINFVPTVFSDIGPVIDKKFELLGCHRSQLEKTNIPGLCILEAAKSAAVFRGGQYRVKYAEGFMPQRLSLPIR
ncbi:MAG: PIG-L deacetylase family protein [Elusimicrobiales bacterium]